MLVLEHGVVVYFDDRDGKQYGFLKVLTWNGQETGEQIFFHFNDGQFVEIVKEDDDVEFIGRVFPGSGKFLWHPKKDEVLAFSRASGKGDRPKAAPWTYAEAYDKRITALQQPHYRVTKVTKLGYGGPGDTSDVIWEGRGANALAGEYPLLVFSGKLSDPLSDAVDLAVGRTTRYSYERWDIASGIFAPSNPNGGQLGAWVECPDPRPRSEEVRRLMGERIFF